MSLRKVYGLFGFSGSGKSSFCSFVESRIDELTVISQDWFYKKDLSSGTNFDDPQTLDAKLILSVLADIVAGKNNISVPIYDFSTHSRTGYREISCKPFVIFEGHMFPLIAGIKDNLSKLIFYSTPLDVSLNRRILRDYKERGRGVESICEQYIRQVRPTALKIESISNSADHYVNDDYEGSLLKLNNAGLF